MLAAILKVLSSLRFGEGLRGRVFVAIENHQLLTEFCHSDSDSLAWFAGTLSAEAGDPLGGRLNSKNQAGCLFWALWVGFVPLTVQKLQIPYRYAHSSVPI